MTLRSACDFSRLDGTLGVTFLNAVIDGNQEIIDAEFVDKEMMTDGCIEGSAGCVAHLCATYLAWELVKADEKLIF